jgi:hypothetical protein
MSKYAELTETELQELLRSDSLEPYEKYDIVLELEKRGTLEFIRTEWIH